MSFVTTNDGARICGEDGGQGQPVAFSHGRPLGADLLAYASD